MSFITGILGAVSAFFKAIGAILGFVSKQQDIKAGVDKQKAADLAETVHDDEQARKISGDVRGMSDRELDDELRRP